MKTTIDNNTRVFQVVTSTGKQAFCNLEQLNEVIEKLETHEGYFKIYHFWDNKQKKASSKLIREMMQAHRIEQRFFY